MWFDNDLFDGIENEDEDRHVLTRKMKQVTAGLAKRERKEKADEMDEDMVASDDSADDRPRKRVKVPLGDQSLAVVDDDLSMDEEVPL